MIIYLIEDRPILTLYASTADSASEQTMIKIE